MAIIGMPQRTLAEVAKSTITIEDELWQDIVKILIVMNIMSWMMKNKLYQKKKNKSLV
jgi:hypothetical protein